MAKAVVRKQALRVAGKTVGEVKAIADSPKEVVEVTTPKEVKETTPSQKETAKKKAEAKAIEVEAIFKASGYAIGDEIQMKSGRIVTVTKLTSRPQGVHLWWETASGPQAGGHYTFGVRGKMVKGVCVDPISGKAIALPEAKASKDEATK